MVHGQAIGIPFRRRKGEQAPPPPKEVAWNPTIESNLPYKEIQYFKFVEGAGWQALNVGEILPVGQRVMICITTTEPYYEVSKVVSSQLANIQIGKNGVSEYDIAGTLTVYSPQILTVTIGISKDYVQWNPVVESNVEYSALGYLNYSHNLATIKVGDYISIGDTVAIRVVLGNTVDEVVNCKVNGQECEIVYVSPKVFDCKFTITSESPQKINITIDEYIRFEDIVQAYPLFFEFTNENNNLISWGGKAKVGSTITRTKGVAYANLLEGLFTVTNPRLNGVPLASAEHVVEKSMVFTCTATWTFDDNEPQVVLSAEKLQIPNSSLKILGHLPDISGHGNHGVFNNFEFAGMSGANGYTELEFSKWRYNTAEKRAEFTISDDVKLNITKVIRANGAILYTLIGDYTTSSIQRYRVAGVDASHPIVFGNDSPTDALLTVTTDGEYEVDWKTYGKNPCIFATWTGDCNITIQQIGEYEGAICFNGVNNFVTIPTLFKGGQQVLMKVNWQNDFDVPGYMYDSNIGDYRNYVIKGNQDQLAYENASKTYINGILNSSITSGDLKDVTHTVISQFDGTSGAPYIGCRYSLENYLKMALFTFMSFSKISEDDKIKELNDKVNN